MSKKLWDTTAQTRDDPTKTQDLNTQSEKEDF